MAWTVETLNDVVHAELEALPADMRRASLGNAHERQGRHLSGDLRYGNWPARRGCPHFRQEDADDPEGGNRAGAEKSQGANAMSKVSDLHRRWMKNPEYRKTHEALAPEFELARAVMAARVTAGLTQEQLAQRMDTTQSVIARLEGGRTRPSTQTLEHLAAATGTRLKISFEPAGAQL